MPSNSSWKRAVHTIAKYGYLEIDEANEMVRFVENPEISALFAECETLFSKHAGEWIENNGTQSLVVVAWKKFDGGLSRSALADKQLSKKDLVDN